MKETDKARYFEMSREFYSLGVLWLDELFVKPQFRGKGVAKEFFRFIENSDEYGFVRLEVESENGRAMKLYKSLGYKDAQYISLYKKTNKSDLEKE